MGEHWRLIVDEQPEQAYWNMAVDVAIYEAVSAGEAAPTLRLYRWAPPAVSIGYFQEYARAVNAAACRAAGVDVVRRPTGGRAVLHDDEVTYSVALPPGHPLVAAAGITDSYRHLSRGLQGGLRALGVEATLSEGVPAPVRPAGGVGNGESVPEGVLNSACFDAPGRYELEWLGRKLVGSAQMRPARGGLLQHGSILLRFDPHETARLLSPAPQAAPLLAEILARRATSVEAATGRHYPFVVAAPLLATGFAEALGLVWEPTGLTPGEIARAGQLQRERFATAAWNIQRPRGRGAAAQVEAASHRG